jgi:hypothetical protein
LIRSRATWKVTGSETLPTSKRLDFENGESSLQSLDTFEANPVPPGRTSFGVPSRITSPKRSIAAETPDSDVKMGVPGRRRTHSQPSLSSEHSDSTAWKPKYEISPNLARRAPRPRSHQVERDSLESTEIQRFRCDRPQITGNCAEESNLGYLGAVLPENRLSVTRITGGQKYGSGYRILLVSGRATSMESSRNVILAVGRESSSDRSGENEGAVLFWINIGRWIVNPAQIWRFQSLFRSHQEFRDFQWITSPVCTGRNVPLFLPLSSFTLRLEVRVGEPVCPECHFSRPRT